MENLPKDQVREINFVFPDINKEYGEIERVAQKYNPDNPEIFAQQLYQKAQASTLTDLTEDMWSVLDNTDSFDIPLDGWGNVAEQVDHVNKETGSARSWQDLKQKIEQSQELDAPIVLKFKDGLHLVSGNTRLMVARAQGKTPKILLVEM